VSGIYKNAVFLINNFCLAIRTHVQTAEEKSKREIISQEWFKMEFSIVFLG